MWRVRNPLVEPTNPLASVRKMTPFVHGVPGVPENLPWMPSAGFAQKVKKSSSHYKPRVCHTFWTTPVGRAWTLLGNRCQQPDDKLAARKLFIDSDYTDSPSGHSSFIWAR